MARRAPLRAEVVFGIHDSLAEVLLPETIHRDARRERVVRRNEPAGQIEAVWVEAVWVRRGRVAIDAGCQRRQHLGHAGLDLRAVAQEIAADMDEVLARLGTLF